MIYEIKDMQSYCRENNVKMLSTYDADFWKPYRDNNEYFDRLFMKKYRSWFPMDQEGDLSEVVTDFAYDVKSWLMINDKRYSELYRIQTIPDDEKYSLTDNVYESEVINESGEHSNEFNKGSQLTSNSGSQTFATHTDTEDNSRTFGTHTDTEDNSRTNGSHTDTEDNSRTLGEQSIDTDATNTTGETGKTITNSTSAFNDSGFVNTDKSEEDDDSRQDTIDQTVVNGERTDTEDLSKTYGSQTNTEDLSKTYGAQTNTEDLSKTYGAHTDTNSLTTTEGARKDTDEGTDSKTIERLRQGNIGVKDVPQMLGDQLEFWSVFSLYDLIFSEIARELLRGGVY